MLITSYYPHTVYVGFILIQGGSVFMQKMGQFSMQNLQQAFLNAFIVVSIAVKLFDLE